MGRDLNFTSPLHDFKEYMYPKSVLAVTNYYQNGLLNLVVVYIFKY